MSRPHPAVRTTAAAFLTLAFAGACSPSPADEVASNCAPGPTLSVSGRPDVRLVSCAGTVGLPDPRDAVTVAPGTTIRVRGLSDWYSHIRSESPDVLAVESSSGHAAELRAIRPGTAILTLATRYCPSATGSTDGTSTACPAAEVIVRAGR